MRLLPLFLLSLSLLFGPAVPAAAMPQDPPTAAKDQKSEAEKKAEEEKQKADAAEAEAKRKAEEEKQKKAAEEAKQQETLIDALKTEAAKAQGQLEKKNQEFQEAAKKADSAPEADKEAAKKKVDALKKEREELANTLKGIITNLEEKKQDTKAYRETLFHVLGEAPKEPEQVVKKEEITQELEALTKDEVFAKMTVAYSKYKGTVQTIQDLGKELGELDTKSPDYAKKKKDLDDAKAASAKAGEVLQAHVRVFKAKKGEGKTLDEIEEYLFTQQGGNFENLSGKVAVSVVTKWLDTAWTSIKDAAPTIAWKLIQFLLILFVFRVIARICSRIVGRALKSKRLHKSDLLADFATRMTKNIIMIFGVVIALEKLDIVDTTPLIAGLGAATLVIGLALQGTLSNFASGLMLLIYRPFDVGSVISVGSVNGKVESLNLVSTTVLTFDNQLVIVPNNNIWGNVITNVTAKKTRRVDLVFGVSYDDDIEHVERILREVVTSHPKVLENPEPNIRVGTLNSSSVDFICRPWCKTSDYWDVYWELTRTVKMRFDQEGITIPYPQQDVYYHSVPGTDDRIPTPESAPSVEGGNSKKPAAEQGRKSTA